MNLWRCVLVCTNTINIKVKKRIRVYKYVFLPVKIGLEIFNDNHLRNLLFCPFSLLETWLFLHRWFRVGIHVYQQYKRLSALYHLEDVQNIHLLCRNLFCFLRDQILGLRDNLQHRIWNRSSLEPVIINYFFIDKILTYQDLYFTSRNYPPLVELSLYLTLFIILHKLFWSY